MKKWMFIIILGGLLLIPLPTYAKALPKLYFEGDLSSLKTKKDNTKVTIRYTSDSINLEGYAKIKLQGHSSLDYEKKNYNIEFYQDEDLTNQQKVDFGWGAQSKYCLKANWIDKTHARNIVTARLVQEVEQKYNLLNDTPHNGTIDGFPIEIYLNDEFLGLYTLNIPKGAWQFNMDENNPNHIVLSAEDWSNAACFKEEAKDLNSSWALEVGEENEATLEKLNRVIRFVINSSDQEFKEQFSSYFNLDAVLNYYVLTQYGLLCDNVAKNMLLVTYDGEIWYPVLYDLDTAWGSSSSGLETVHYESTKDIANNQLFERLEKNFPNELANRYFALKKEIFTKEHVLNLFNEFEKSIPKESFQKEQERWTDIPGFSVEQIASFIDVRTPIVDKFFYDLYTDEIKVEVVYEENKNGTVTARLVSNREDVSLWKNNKTSYDYEHTFTKEGTYTFYYQDGNGNRNSITATTSGNVLTSSSESYDFLLLGLFGILIFSILFYGIRRRIRYI